MIRILAAVLLICMGLGAASAEMAVTVVLPEGLHIIEEEAFCGDASITSAIVPEGVTEIRSRAFANCALGEISLPESLTVIADDAFEGCDGLRISAEAGSYAHDWALERGWIKLEAGCAADRTSAVLGEKIEWTVSTNRSDVLRYVFELYCDGELKARLNTDSAVFSYLPNTAGSYELKATALTDGDSAVAEEAVSVTEGGYTPAEDFVYTVADGEVSITKYTGAETVLIIPEAIDGCPVTSVSFEINAEIERVVLPDTVTVIPDYAFYACYKLTDVNIPDGVQRIGNGAFADCRKLTSVSLGRSVAEIGDVAFLNCPLLEFVTFAGDGPAKVGEQAFLDCTKLKYFRFGAGFKGVEYEAFRNCTGLSELDFVPGACSAENVTIDIRAFCGCPVESIDLPDGVTVIKDYAFQGCSKLQRVTLPESVEKIGYYSFPKYADHPVFTVKEGSYVHEWCINQERNFILEE